MTSPSRGAGLAGFENLGFRECWSFLQGWGGYLGVILYLFELRLVADVYQLDNIVSF